VVEDKKKITPFQIVLYFLAVVVVFALILYVVLNTVDEELAVGRYFSVFFTILFVLSFLGGVTYLLYRKLFFTPKKDLFKETVAVGRALELVREAVIMDTNIPHIRAVWEDRRNPPLRAFNPMAVSFRNETVMSDPSGQTADRFLAVEMTIREGDRRGVHVMVIRLDQGEEWIRKNWNMRMRDNTPFNMFRLENQKYPLTSARDFQERAISRRIELAEEGYSEEELNRLIDPYVNRQVSPNPVIVQQPVPEPIRTPNVIVNQPSDEDEDEGDVGDDIDEYRRRKRRSNTRSGRR
jgi:hypothetical protein